MAKGRSTRTRKQTPDAEELLIEGLREIYSAENQLARALPRFERAVETQALKEVMNTRSQQAERLIQDLDEAFEEMDETPGRRKNVAAEGLISDAREHVQEIEGGPALDSVLIASLQKTEHYCIAAWGTARSMAKALGQKKVVDAMERALKEGRELDDRLTQLAEEEVTPALMPA